MTRNPRSRRRVLQLTGAGLVSGLAGCLFGGDSTPTPPGSPPDGSPTPTSSPTPTPTPTCPGAPDFAVTPTNTGLSAAEYPAYPAELTKESARQFVVDYEAAYRHNEALGDYWIAGTVDVSVDTEIKFLQAREDGYAMGALSRVKTYRRTATPTPTATPAPWIDLDFAAWYWCRPAEVRRHETDPPDLEEPVPDLSDDPKIVC